MSSSCSSQSRGWTAKGVDHACARHRHRICAGGGHAAESCWRWPRWCDAGPPDGRESRCRGAACSLEVRAGRVPLRARVGALSELRRRLKVRKAWLRGGRTGEAWAQSKNQTCWHTEHISGWHVRPAVGTLGLQRGRPIVNMDPVEDRCASGHPPVRRSAHDLAKPQLLSNLGRAVRAAPCSVSRTTPV